VIFPLGIKSLISCLPEGLEDGSNELSPVARYALADEYRCLLEVRQAMSTFQDRIEQLAGQRLVGDAAAPARHRWQDTTQGYNQEW